MPEKAKEIDMAKAERWAMTDVSRQQVEERVGFSLRILSGKLYSKKRMRMVKMFS